MAMPTKWEVFREKWIGGCGSSLCPNARRVCLANGQVPCDVLFVGEAPSVGADVVGKPFVGESGYLLQDMVDKAMPDSVRRMYTNVVGCIPRNTGPGKAVTTPPTEAILACRPRLQEFIAVCNPRLIIAVGRVAQNALVEMQSGKFISATIPVVYVTHPSHILQTVFNGSIARRAIETIRKAVAEHVLGTPE
jgi:DNA polymerase